MTKLNSKESKAPSNPQGDYRASQQTWLGIPDAKDLIEKLRFRPLESFSQKESKG